MNVSSRQIKSVALTLLASLSIFLTVPSPAQAGEAKLCRNQFLTEAPTEIAKVEVRNDVFQNLLQTLRATLTGKLATVWRSEWKTKLTAEDSNRYVVDLIKKFLTPETQNAVLNGVDLDAEGAVRTIQKKLARLQDEGHLKEKDELLVRDPAPPEGAHDRTFTYYTKPIIAGEGDGKHQVRIRNYVRQINLDELVIDKVVKGYAMDGTPVALIKMGDGAYKLKTQRGDDEIETLLTATELRSQLGEPLYLFAPHGRTFKLEIKSALDDQIVAKKFPLLGGPHLVEKLDIGLSMEQVNLLFNSTSDRRVARRNISTLKRQLLKKNPKNRDRIDAIFAVLRAGLTAHSDFLKVEGATLYDRTAFEGKSGFQTTIDRDQGTFVGQMYTDGKLKNPAQTMRENVINLTGESDARHVELKIPITAVQSILGVTYAEKPPTLTLTEARQNKVIKAAIETYYPYVTSADHRGKFNYIRQTSEMSGTIGH